MSERSERGQSVLSPSVRVWEDEEWDVTQSTV